MAPPSPRRTPTSPNGSTTRTPDRQSEWPSFTHRRQGWSVAGGRRCTNVEVIAEVLQPKWAGMVGLERPGGAINLRSGSPRRVMPYAAMAPVLSALPVSVRSPLSSRGHSSSPERRPVKATATVPPRNSLGALEQPMRSWPRRSIAHSHTSSGRRPRHQWRWHLEFIPSRSPSVQPVQRPLTRYTAPLSGCGWSRCRQLNHK